MEVQEPNRDGSRSPAIENMVWYITRTWEDVSCELSEFVILCWFESLVHLSAVMITGIVVKTCSKFEMPPSVRLLQKRDSSSGKEQLHSSTGAAASVDLNDPDLLLPSVLPFKSIQLTDRYPKGQTRGRHWKHLKQILQAENYQTYPADEPTCTCYFSFFCDIWVSCQLYVTRIAAFSSRLDWW